MKPNEVRMVIQKCSLTPLGTLAGFIKFPLWRTSSSGVGAKCCSTGSGSWRRGGALERLISTSGFLFFHLIRFSSRSTRCRQPGNRKWRQDSAKRGGEGGEVTADEQEWRVPWDGGDEAVPHTFQPAAKVMKNARLRATVHCRLSLNADQTPNVSVEGWEQWSGVSNWGVQPLGEASVLIVGTLWTLSSSIKQLALILLPPTLKTLKMDI